MNILYPIDFSEDSISSLNYAARVAEDLKADIHVLHVFKITRVVDNLKEAFAKYMVDHSLSIRTIFNVEIGTNVEIVLAEYAEKFDAEMIVMHKSKKTFLERIFGVSHTKSMTNRLAVPLMIVN